MQNVSFITDSDINFFCNILSLSEILLGSFSIEVLLFLDVDIVLLEVLTPGLETALDIISFSVLLLVFIIEVFFSLLILLVIFCNKIFLSLSSKFFFWIDSLLFLFLLNSILLMIIGLFRIIWDFLIIGSLLLFCGLF